VQKFTRAITREIELGGERLALTFTEQGLTVRPVGSRRPPREVSWPALLSAVVSSEGAEPGPEQVAATVQVLKGGGRGAQPRPPVAESAPAPAAHRETPAPPEKPAERPPAPPASDASSLLGRLAHWLGQHRRRFLEGLGPGATPHQLQALETALGHALPDDLRELLAWHNGQDDETVGRFREHWFLMGTHEIQAAWQELTGSSTAGWKREWIPFLEDDRGNYVFLDTSQPGGAVREYWEQNPDRPTVAPSLAAWLQEFVGAVERGGYAEDPERGLFVRKEE
jgi:cell wall assembly regulator SMI1